MFDPLTARNAPQRWRQVSAQHIATQNAGKEPSIATCYAGLMRGETGWTIQGAATVTLTRQKLVGARLYAGVPLRVSAARRCRHTYVIAFEGARTSVQINDARWPRQQIKGGGRERVELFLQDRGVIAVDQSGMLQRAERPAIRTPGVTHRMGRVRPTTQLDARAFVRIEKYARQLRQIGRAHV